MTNTENKPKVIHRVFLMSFGYNYSSANQTAKTNFGFYQEVYRQK